VIFPFDSEAFTQAIAEGRVEWRKHVLVRLLERGISQARVLECARSGTCIQSYHDDMPFPSALVFAMADNEPLHVVAAFDGEAKKAYIITAYKPSLDIFETDFITRKKK
jgi:Domain of unknown function (DUF4258)